MATKFKDGLISGDEIKSEGDIQAISGKNIAAVSTDPAKKITTHHDGAGGHISATQRLDINSPLLNLYMTDKLILSGDTNETTLYHSNDGSVKLTTQAQGITVYGSDGVTAKKFKFPALAGGAAAAAGSTAATDYALIQAQKIGTAVGETSVFDFSLGDNRSNDKADRDEFRFRFKSGGINSGNEYSLMDIGALSNGVAILDLTVSHDQRDDDAVGESANSQIKAGKFIGEASLLAATVLPSATTVNTHSSSTAAGQKLVVLDNVTAAIVGMRIRGTGIAAGTTIADINTVTKTITLSQNTSAIINANTNLTIETDFGKGLVNNTTDNLSEGTTNQYFTQSRARGSISVGTAAAASGGGALSYTAGVFTYTPPDLSSFLTAVPLAAEDTIGGMKLVDNTDQTVAANTVSTTTGRSYAVQLNSDNQAVVNVPWEDNHTTYAIATASTAGLVKIGYTESGQNYPVELSSNKMYVNVPWQNTVTAATTRADLSLATTDNVTFNDISGRYITASEELRSKKDVVAYHSSDRRLKENIVNIPNALDKVNQLNGVTYDWTEAHIKSRGGEDDYFVKKNDTGLIAQEVEQVLPEVIRSREDGYLGIQYDKIVGLLVEAIKELKVEVEELKKNK